MQISETSQLQGCLLVLVFYRLPCGSLRESLRRLVSWTTSLPSFCPCFKIGKCSRQGSPGNPALSFGSGFLSLSVKLQTIYSFLRVIVGEKNLQVLLKIIVLEKNKTQAA